MTALCIKLLGLVLVALAATKTSVMGNGELLDDAEVRGIGISSPLRDCQDVYKAGLLKSGIYIIQPAWSRDQFKVFCNMEDGGGWTVIQRRHDGTENFNKPWCQYRVGFGGIDGEFWIGLEKIYEMTNEEPQELRIDIQDSQGNIHSVAYDSFRIAGSEFNYQLVDVGTFSGPKGMDSFSPQLNNQFSAADRENSDWEGYACSDGHQGGWWFGYGSGMTGSGPFCEDACNMFPIGGSNCARCAVSNLNGPYLSSTPGATTFWVGLPGQDCDLLFTEMKIRPASK